MSTTESTDDGSIDLSALWTETQQELEKIDQTDPVAAGQLANDVVPKIARAVYEDDAPRTVAESVLKQFSRNVGIKKAVIDNKFDDELDRLEGQETETPFEEGDEDEEGVPIDTLLRTQLEKVVVFIPTDASANLRYNWIFTNGVEVETETEHLASNSFCQEYHDASGGYKYANPPEFEGSWEHYIQRFFSHLRNSQPDKVSEVVIEGVRTQAIDELKNLVENTTATTDLRTSIQQKRPFVVGPDADEVQVPSDVIRRMLSDYDDLSYNDLQIELDKRELRTGNNRSVDIEKSTERMWRLKRDWVDVDVDEDAEALDTENGGDAGEVDE